MKILFSAENYPTPGQPVTAFIKVLIHELVKQGHDVTVIAPQSIVASLKNKTRLQPKHFLDIVDCGHKIKEINVYRPYVLTSGYGRTKKITLWCNKKVVNRIASKLEKPDICYAHMWTSCYNIYFYAKRNNIPLFVASGEDKILIHEFISENLIFKIREFIKGVICVSTKNMNESISCGFTTSNKCIVLPNAIDDKTFYQMNKSKVRNLLKYSEDDFIVAFLGRFYNRKGVNRVSDAIKYLNDKRIKSIFIGTNNSGEDLQPDCDGILFKGSLPHNEVPLYLNAADVFVLPTLAEGCSNSIVESMACGLPIISSDLSFNYDILNENNSILVDPNNIIEIANAIKQIKEDKHLRLIKSQNAVLTAKKLTIKERTSKIVDFIEFKLYNK